MDVFLRVKPFFSHHSKDRTLMSDVETEGGTSWSHRAPASEGLSRDAGLHTAAARWLSISTLQFSLGAGRLCHAWGESNAASRLRPGWRGRCCRLRGLLRSGRVHHFPSIHPPARFHQMPQPQPLPPRRRAPPGRQRLEERTGPAGPEVREQVGLAGVSEGKDGEGEPEWD